MSDGKFQKGNVPYNKGIKRGSVGGKGTFQSGENHTGEKHPSWLGGVQIMQKDCVHVWTGNKTRARRPRVVYEQNFGKIPKGYIIVHKDDDSHNDAPENLEAITRAEHVRRTKLKNKTI